MHHLPVKRTGISHNSVVMIKINVSVVIAVLRGKLRLKELHLIIDCYRLPCILQTLQDEVKALQTQMDYAQDFVDGLLTDATPETDTSSVTRPLQNIVDRHTKLCDKLDKLLAQMESGSQQLQNFQVHMQEYFYVEFNSTFCYDTSYDISCFRYLYYHVGCSIFIYYFSLSNCNYYN